MNNIVSNIINVIGSVNGTSSTPQTNQTNPTTQKDFKTELKRAEKQKEKPLPFKQEETSSPYGSTEVKPSMDIEDVQESNAPDETTDSKSINSHRPFHIGAQTEEGIVDILEGFGMLDQMDLNTDEAKVLQIDTTFAQQATLEIEQEAQTSSSLQESQQNTDPRAGTHQSGQAETILQPEMSSYIVNALADDNDAGSVENTNKADLPERELATQIAEKLEQSSISSKTTPVDTATESKPDTKESENGLSQSGKESVLFSMPQAGQKAEILSSVDQPELPKEPVAFHMQENFTRIVDTVNLHQADGVQQFELTLKPQHLGKVNITLTMDQDGIKAQIKTSDLAAKGLISKDIAQLEQLFLAKDINVTEVEVLYQSPALNLQNQTNPHNLKNFADQSNTGKNGVQRPTGQTQQAEYHTAYENYFTPTPRVYDIPEYSSVEFSA